MGRSPSTWRSRDVWAIALSAFFADWGYQAVLVGFPLFLVLALRDPVWVFGLVMAVAYGGGAVASWIGGRLGDRAGHRRVALAGNSAIPLLSLSGLVSAAAPAGTLLSLGWWARNLRSPSRRAMLTQAVPDEENRARAFGFLHALDVGGGVLAALSVLALLALHVAFRWIFLATALPLLASTVALTRATVGRAGGNRERPPVPGASPPESGSSPPVPGASTPPGDPGGRIEDGLPAGSAVRPGAPPAPPDAPVGAPGLPTARTGAEATGAAPTGVDATGREAPTSRARQPHAHRFGPAQLLVAAAALYGFTSYSIGFPVLTVAEGTHARMVGVLAFLLFQAVSAATGYLAGSRLGRSLVGSFRQLAVLGYGGAALGAIALGVGAATGAGAAVLLVGVAVLGIALGVIETLEPTAMSVLAPSAAAGRGFGALGAARAAGVFVGNLVMGLLYVLGPAYSYGYAALVGVAAAGIALMAAARARPPAAAMPSAPEPGG